MTSKKDDEKTKNEKSKFSDFNCCDWNFEEMKEFMKKFCSEGEDESGCCSRIQEMCYDKSYKM